MKKTHFLIPVSLLLSLVVNAQNKRQLTIPQEKMAPSSRVNSLDPDFKKQVKLISKAFGDTIYYQDFAGGIPTGWSVVNNKPNNFAWKWDTIYQNGQFSSAGNVINSTTASNGFMTLPADFYNTPIPLAGAVGMDTYFESDSIDLTMNGAHPNGVGSVWVSYQQSVRYCCSGANRLVLQVSTDNFTTFREYDATNAMAVSSAIASQTNIIKITNVAANATSVKIRFLSKDNSHFYWMIDDFAIVEGPSNDVELLDPRLEFNVDYTYNPFYHQIPYDLFPPLPLSGLVRNNGGNDLTGVKIEGDITHTADVSGGAGVGLVYSTSSTSMNLVSSATNDTAIYTLTNSPRFVPTILGEFRVDLIATSDSIDEIPTNSIYSQHFNTADTIYARDDNGYAGGTGPGSYVRNGQAGGTASGDKFGTMYIIESRTGNGGYSNVPSSITYAVSGDPLNIGVEITPKIWKYEEDSLFTAGTINAAFAGGVVASSFIPYTIQASDTNTLLTLPLDNGSAVFNGLDSGQYVVGWEVTNTNGGNSFEVREDVSSGFFQKDVTCFINFGHSTGWGWVDANPVIRLNMPPLPFIGINPSKKTTAEFSVNPNPNNGLFELSISSTNQEETYLMELKNNLGQVAYKEELQALGAFNKMFDFSFLEKGVYFMTLTNKDQQTSKKIIIK